MPEGERVLNICAHEDRPEDFVALKLLVLSLARHEPAARVHVPGRAITGARRDWLAAQPNVVLHDDIAAAGAGWDVKPSLLLALLDKGLPEIVWIDADVVLSRPIAPLLAGLDAETLVVAEDAGLPGLGPRRRAGLLGLLPARDLDASVNSAVLRVTERHRPLLEAWQALHASRPYRDAQGMPYRARPAFLRGDQDLLEGLLGAAGHADTPVRFLRLGRHIAHAGRHWEYDAAARLRALVAGPPPLVHATKRKLWRAEARPIRGALVNQVSLHRLHARAYADQLAPDERDWLTDDTRPARLLRLAAAGNPSLMGLPFGLVGSLRRLQRGIARWRARFTFGPAGGRLDALPADAAPRD